MPFLLPVAALTFFPGLWLYGAYAYNNHHDYNYHNKTSGRNESIPIMCLCQEYSVCGCEDNNNSTYLNSVLNVKDSSELPSNSSTVRVADVNGTRTIIINGTLPNGTTAADPSIEENSSIPREILNFSGYWLMITLVIASVTLV